MRRLSGMRLLPLALACAGAVAAEVDPGLAARAAREGRVDVLIVLPDQSAPPLAPLAPDADYRARRRAEVEALRSRAAARQAGLRAALDAAGVAYRPYWIANLVEARLSAAGLAAVAARADVARVAANPVLALKTPAGTNAASRGAAGVAWGVAKIRAPEVWAAGYRGQGVVVGGEDTGYQWDHPALKPHYRGWDGETAVHDRNWHDAIHDSSGNPCGNDSPFPCDDYGHGTHTAGTMVGDDGAGHRTGVAPAAQWIGCRNMDDGAGTPARYIECMQWMLAPTDLAGGDPDPDLAPDIVSNSWTCIPSEGCTVGDEIAAAVGHLVDGGIFFVAAAANDGPGCGTITDPPAIYDASFVVGATDSADDVAGFSSRGPVAGSPLTRPDLAAPGVNVVSAWNDGGYRPDSGTSMATPHVAGAAALLLSAVPSLKGHPAEIGALLRASTATSGLTDNSNAGCGGLTIADWPNFQAGYGRLDVLAAVDAALAAADRIFSDGFDD